MDIVCMLEVMYVITILYHYTADNNTVSVIGQNIINHINAITKLLSILTIFFSKEVILFQSISEIIVSHILIVDQ